MSSIAAPVVPKIFANSAPANKKKTFASGELAPLTPMWMPPETTNSEPTSAMKLMYSCAA